MKFSILTPSFNSGKYIRRAIESVLKQNYHNWEHIIADGGSADDTVGILKSYSHLKWTSEKDKGQSDAMNKAFERSTGDLIIYLNADDELQANALTSYLKYFSTPYEYDMVVADLAINNSGATAVNSPSISLQQILNYWPCIFPANPVSYAYKRGLQLKIGRFPTNNHYSMDYWFLLRAFLKGRIYKKDFIAGTYHFDGSNKSANPVNSKKWLKKVRNGFLLKYFYKPEVAKFIARKLITA